MLLWFLLMSGRSLSKNEIQEILENGDIALEGQFLPGSNYTFLVRVSYRGKELPAVYKPTGGERPLWDFPPASLARREVAAYRLSELLGFHLVPCTVLRAGPLGPGALQQFIRHDPAYHYFTFTPQDRQRLRPVVLFDLIANNADRKGSHLLIEKRSHRLYAIDHGLCFHAEEKLRTVLWDFAGEAIPQPLLESVQAFLALGHDLFAVFRPYLSRSEIAALRQRVENLLRNPVFPYPPPYRRAFPYPPL